MKKSDIKIGEEYAYSTYEHGSRQRVKVIGECKVKQGWGYGAKTITGSKVQVLDSRTGEPVLRKNEETGEEVPVIYNAVNRDIREPWAPYAERQASMRRARQAHQRREHEDRDTRARFLLDLIPALRHVGIPDTTATLYGDDKKALPYLELHMPEDLSDRGEGITAAKEFTAPYAESLAKYVASGAKIAVPADDLLRIAR